MLLPEWWGGLHSSSSPCRGPRLGSLRRARVRSRRTGSPLQQGLGAPVPRTALGVGRPGPAAAAAAAAGEGTPCLRAQLAGAPGRGGRDAGGRAGHPPTPGAGRGERPPQARPLASRPAATRPPLAAPARRRRPADASPSRLRRGTSPASWSEVLKLWSMDHQWSASSIQVVRG
ncbi:unnamed protein product [Lepidochelys kempii]